MVSAAQKIAITSTGGVAAGASLSTLAAEFTARSTGQSGWPACGVKALVKGVIGLLTYGLSTRLNGMKSTFAEIFSYTSFGTIFLDVVLAAYPGGIPGLAEDWAVTARVFAAGGRETSEELRALEKMAGVTDVAGLKKGTTIL